MGSGQILLRTGSDHHLYFFVFLKKIATTGSSATFLSPEPNGQGSYLRIFYQSSFEKNYNQGTSVFCNFDFTNMK